MVYKNYIWDEQFDLNVSRGKVRGASAIHKFGAVPSMSQNTTGTIWDVNDTLYPWSAFDSVGIVSVSQVNPSDNNKHVVIVGLDENFNEVSETFIVSSSSATVGIQTFSRVYNGYIGNGSITNVGDIDVTKNGTTVMRILSGRGQTEMSIYTVPAGKTAYLYKGVCSCQEGVNGTGDMFVRFGDTASFKIGHSFEITGGGSPYIYNFSFPIKLPEKTDIDVRIKARTNNGRYTAAFDILLIDEDL